MKKISVPKKNWHYLAKGKRSIVYTARLNKRKIAIKVYKKSKELNNLSTREADNLILLNKYNIGPKLIYYDKDKIIYYFVKGKKILDYLSTSDKNSTKNTIKKIFDICFKLDSLNINKKEMSHPLKHIIIGKKNVNFIDFERASFSKNPKNTSQFYDFLISKKVSEILKEKDLKINQNLTPIKQYKKNQNKNSYNKLIKALFLK